MSFVQRLEVDVVTAADGSATAFSAPVTGQISTIRYVKDGSNPFSNGVGITVTAETTGEQIWAESNVNASATRAPRQATHGTDGSASLYAAAGTAVQDKIAVANDRIKIVIAGGGNAKNGAFFISLV